MRPEAQNPSRVVAVEQAVSAKTDGCRHRVSGARQRAGEERVRATQASARRGLPGAVWHAPRVSGPLGAWLSIACALALWGCGGAGTPSPARIQADPVVEAWYDAWVKAGEPPLGGSGSGHDLAGIASWYGPQFHGRRTANGEVFDMYGMTAAHRTLPFGTILRVSRPSTGQFVVVRINDRGPYVDGRIVDLSFGAAHDLGMVDAGITDVELDVVAWGSGRRIPAR